MSQTHPGDRSDEGEGAVESAAADWMVRVDQGLTAGEEQEFARWLAVDPRHARVFHALEATWNLMGHAAAASTSRPREPAPGRREPRWRPITLAAAATLVAGLFWWSQPPGVMRNHADAFALSASTDVGVLRELALPDGSAVQLNTDSEISVQFSAAERRVRLLRGEAHFAIARNPSRPFFVSASGVEVRAVGTAFNVRVRPTAVEVLVTEGKVRVDDPSGDSLLHPAASATYSPRAGASPPVLTAGEKAIVEITPAARPAAAPIATVPPQTIKQALAWRDRRLDFESTPLAEIVAEMNRYNRHKLVIADPRLAQERFGGSFPANDSEPLVRLLEGNFGVTAERRASETLLRLAR